MDPIYIFSIYIIGIIIIILIYYYMNFDYDPLIAERQYYIDQTITWLYQTTNKICYSCGLYPIYEIKPTNQITYTEKTNLHEGTIYLVIWDEVHSRVFTPNTLLYTTLQEISHVLSSPTASFSVISTLLLNKATEFGYYDPFVPPEPHYSINYRSM